MSSEFIQVFTTVRSSLLLSTVDLNNSAKYLHHRKQFKGPGSNPGGEIEIGG